MRVIIGLNYRGLSSIGSLAVFVLCMSRLVIVESVIILLIKNVIRPTRVNVDRADPNRRML